MSTQLTVLPNGLRVVSHAMGHLETVSLGVWVGVGARHEQPAEHGISHLLEHMAFKGTRRRSAQSIAEEIEAVGGEINAATSLESTAYYARVLKGDEGVALDILADILQDSTFAADELERERTVILQEIAASLDVPDDIAYDLVHEAAFPGQPVGRPILGTPDSIKAATAPDLARFLATHYRPERMVVAAAGAIHHDALVRHAEALFGSLSSAPGGEEQAARYVGGTRAWSKPFEQSHLLIGFPGPSYRDETFLTAQVLSGLLGGGMSSRLFQEVREKRGLCYAIYSSAWGFNDAGLLAIHAATGTDMMSELIDVVAAEVQRLAAHGPAPAEVARSKAQLKAGLLMSLESSSARAEQMARHILVHGRLIPVDELVARVDDVSPDKVRALAAAIIAAPPSVAVVGAGRKSRTFAERTQRAIAV